MMISFINLQAIIQWGYKTTSKISYDILRNYFKDKMFKIGDAETKISVTTWNGAVRIHFRKFYHSKFNHKMVSFEAGHRSNTGGMERFEISHFKI